MIETIYVERDLFTHPRAKRIISKYAGARVVDCEHYGEIFNRKGQNFRLQKQSPALILARKNGRKLYPTPPQHALGAPHNYYFSHLLNCPFDCRYCFLQGKFSSANHVLFVNYEEFLAELDETVARHEETVHIFSGYDCDSLALEPVTGFVEWLIDHLPTQSNYLLELRTKSAQIRQLRRKAVNERILLAYSLAPEQVVENFEKGTSRLGDRLNALQTLQNDGWTIGIRIDPMIDFEGCETTYREFFEQINRSLNLQEIHSVTLGTMRFPDSYYKKINALYPNSQLLASAHSAVDGTTGYSMARSRNLINRALEYFSQHIDPGKIFVHHPDQTPDA